MSLYFSLKLTKQCGREGLCKQTVAKSVDTTPTDQLCALGGSLTASDSVLPHCKWK